MNVLRGSNVGRHFQSRAKGDEGLDSARLCLTPDSQNDQFPSTRKEDACLTTEKEFYEVVETKQEIEVKHTAMCHTSTAENTQSSSGTPHDVNEFLLLKDISVTSSDDHCSNSSTINKTGLLQKKKINNNAANTGTVFGQGIQRITSHLSDWIHSVDFSPLSCNAPIYDYDGIQETFLDNLPHTNHKDNIIQPEITNDVINQHLKNKNHDILINKYHSDTHLKNIKTSIGVSNPYYHYPISCPRHSVQKNNAYNLNGNVIGDALWDGLKLTTNNIFNHLGQWINDTVINSEMQRLPSTHSSHLHHRLTLSTPLQISLDQSYKRVSSSKRSIPLANQTVPLQCYSTQQNNSYNLNNKRESERLKFHKSHGTQQSVVLDQSCTNGYRLDKATNYQTVNKNHSILNSKDNLSLNKSSLNPIRTTSGKVIYQEHVSRDQRSMNKTKGRLPPPPTPEELIKPPSRSAIMSKIYRTDFWREQEILPQLLELPEATLWQGLWHLYDSDTKKVRLNRLRQSLYGNGPSSRQVMKRSDEVCDCSVLTWREAWKSHIELTIFSIENTPYIGQVVIETDGFRINLPFKVQFVRIPITHINQKITIWFNSAYPEPYGRRRSKLLFSRTVYDPEDLSDESDDDEEDVRNALIEEKNNFKQLTLDTAFILANCHSVHMNPPYNPESDWPTYFRLDLPVQTLIDMRYIEDSCIIAPQGVFYHNNYQSLSQYDMFRLLCREAKIRLNDPKVKFSAKYYYQGNKYLIYTGDSTPSHLLTACSSHHHLIRDSYSNLYGSSQLSINDDSIMSHADISHNSTGSYLSKPLDRSLFDVRLRTYKNIPGVEEHLLEKKIYVGAYDDQIDLQVSIEMNRQNGELIKVMEGYGGTAAIERICPGLYTIYGEEVHIDIEYSDPSDLDLNHYIFNAIDWKLRLKDHPTHLNQVIAIAMVKGDDFIQPLHDFIKQSRKNLRILNRDIYDTSKPTNTNHFVINHTQDTHKKTEGSIVLPNLMLSNSLLPFGARDDPRGMLKLARHAEAIHENLIFQQLCQTGFQNETSDSFPIPKLSTFLAPPILKIDQFSEPVPVTFYWDDDFTNPRVLPLDTSKKLPDYLKLPNLHPSQYP